MRTKSTNQQYFDFSGKSRLKVVNEYREKYTPGPYLAVPYPKLQRIRAPVRTYKVRNLNLEIRSIDLLRPIPTSIIYKVSPVYNHFIPKGPPPPKPSEKV